MNSVWQFSTAHSIKFGLGARDQLPNVFDRLKLRRPVIITDSTLSNLPMVRSLVDSIPAAILFDGGEAEPTVATALEAVRAAEGGKAEAVIGIGGGSNLDVAKIVSIVLAHGGQPQDYFGFDRVPAACVPLIAMPTTAGTGSEVSHSAVLTDTDAQVKVSTLSPWLRPTVAIIDPELTMTCPRNVTAESGIDALVHAIEAYTNKSFREMVGVDPQARAYEGSYPLTKLLAGEAIRLVAKSLVIACNEPNNVVAREDMAQAAMLAGMAFSNSGVGIVHALEYPVGALTHCGHGEGNGLLLPHVMRFNRDYCRQEFAEIAELMSGQSDDPNIEARADLAISLVEQLQAAVGIRTRLSQLGMNASDIGPVASKAFEIKRLMDINRRPPSLADLELILKAAL
ncbi:MAG: iron-containing alcohol dehydrogenase [Aureliella sp.]